ncbi:alpha/beta fold hydrolase [Streptomyces sp. NPDC007905]|uniref:thioesterase II family protein n=1 Tax=Streptomyces sp. NPDC007905 TaxID=3364788 RepID=UPI0036DFD6F7
MSNPRAVTLICLPFAGAGASFFRPWQALADDHTEVVAVQLPGRERLIDEEPLRTVPKAVEWLWPGITERLDRADAPCSTVLFGHCLGAVLAYELACRLTDSGRPVAGIVVSGSPGPWTARDFRGRATGQPDDEFIRRVEEYSGYSHGALADPEMRELLLPSFRADVEMDENYRADHDTILDVPITAMRGHDDHLVGTDLAGEWAAATTAEFTLAEVSGGHMYLTETPEHVLRQAAGLGLVTSRGARKGAH